MATKKKTITAEQFRRETEQLAYEFYIQRKGQPGSHEEDWIKAETELKKLFNIAKD